MEYAHTIRADTVQFDNMRHDVVCENVIRGVRCRFLGLGDMFQYIHDAPNLHYNRPASTVNREADIGWGYPVLPPANTREICSLLDERVPMRSEQILSSSIKPMSETATQFTLIYLR